MPTSPSGAAPVFGNFAPGARDEFQVAASEIALQSKRQQTRAILAELSQAPQGQLGTGRRFGRRSVNLTSLSNPFESSQSSAQLSVLESLSGVDLGQDGHTRPQTAAESLQVGKLQGPSIEEQAAAGMKYRFGRVQGAHHVWLRSQGIWYGNFGKVSMGRLDGKPSSQKVAIKEMRQQPKISQRLKTRPVGKNQIYGEISRTMAIRRTIEERRGEIERSLWPTRNPLDAVRTGIQQSLVFDAFEDVKSAKIYMVSTLELGSVTVLEELLDRVGDDRLANRLRADLTASIGAQSFVELAAMHRFARFAHLDLKLSNLQINGFGQAKIADFGLSAELDGAHNARGVRGHRGSVVAPEMLSPPGGHPADRPLLSSATDVFALSYSLLAMLVGDGSHLFRRNMAKGAGALQKIDSSQAEAELKALANLTQQAKLPRGDTALPASGDDNVDLFFAQAARNHSGLLLALLPGLAADPNERPDAAEMARALAPHLPAAMSVRQASLLNLFRQAESSGVYHEVFADAERFAALPQR